MSENVELVRSIYARLNEAYATGEYAAADIATFSHPDVVLRTSGLFPESGEYRAHDALREFAESQAQAFQSMSVEPREYVDRGRRVVVPVTFGGKGRHTGIDATFEVVHVWTVTGGKVSELAM
jgi:ketosteroid isomerase-like protein